MFEDLLSLLSRQYTYRELLDRLSKTYRSPIGRFGLVRSSFTQLPAAFVDRSPPVRQLVFESGHFLDFFRDMLAHLLEAFVKLQVLVVRGFPSLD